MLAGAIIALLTKSLYAQPKTIEIPMYSIGSQTYYIDSVISGAGKHSMLVDTGSGYSVINETTLKDLMQSGNAHYISKLKGRMADGTERIVPVYEISSITLNNNCTLHNVKAAVIPGSAREILGISTLIQGAPFSLSFDPPVLKLSQCMQTKG